jgi:activator of HSP90 ATPase
MSDVIQQEVVLDASTSQVFEALMDSKTHSDFTGDPAIISRDVGGKFSAHDGMVSGINVELVPNKRIVQAWRAKPFPEGVYTIARIELDSQGAKKTKLTLTHQGVPSPALEMISKGWEENYWAKLKAYFAS